MCIPPNAESLNLLVESDVDFTKTVIWLDDIQRFLEPGNFSLETTQRLLLQRDRPAVIIGTIWPEKYSQLRGTGSEEYSDDIRRVLELGRRFDILDFTEAEQARAREISQVDPRVSEALTDGPCPRLTEHLAAAPELVHRWVQADNPLGGAVVTAAVSARLLGHPQPMDREMLLNLSLSQLDGTQRATAPEDWFEQALNWATLPVRGASAPLAAYAREIGNISGYIASDLLVQYAQNLLALKKFTIPNTFGELLISLSTPEACAAIGLTTEKWEDSRLSLLAYKTAAERENAFASTVWATHLDGEGQAEEARQYLLRAAASGYVPAMTLLAISLSRLGETEEAILWGRRAAASGNASATGTLGALLYAQGNREEALTWTKTSIRAGSHVAVEQLALLLNDASDIEPDIVDRVRVRAEEGSVAAMQALGRILISKDDFVPGFHWLESAANKGDGIAARILFKYLTERGESDRALDLIQASAESGDTFSMTLLGMTLIDQGGAEDALNWLRRAAAEGGAISLLALGVTLWESGHQEEAREWFARVDASGDEKAREILSNYLREEGISSIEQ
ncbi:tetratricopeptide repeat protein [Streptomyces sp. NPDC028722]|uniref:tetratricopeptide repeat protein n=1 Tax=Streptomyces sp. NPDC028722 TaxID=3155016 RepID=UPI0033D5769A